MGDRDPAGHPRMPADHFVDPNEKTEHRAILGGSFVYFFS